jgi:hypothetical protein
MTVPLNFGSVGNAYAELHLRSDPADEDLKKALKKIGDDANVMAKKHGENYSTNFTKSIVADMEKHVGKDIAGVVERETTKEKVKVKVETDVDNNSITRVARSIATRLTSALRNIFSRGGSGGGLADVIEGAAGGGNAAGGGGGIFGSIFGGISSVFAPIAGIPPVAILLTLAIEALVGAVAALLNVLAPLAYVVFLLPAGIATLAAAIIPLIFAFNGLGAAITAINSGDPQAIADAFKNISPSAQQVAKDIAALTKDFGEMKLVWQEAFFSPLKGAIGTLRSSLGDIIGLGFEKVLGAAGEFAANIIKTAENPAVQTFLTALFNAAAALFNNTSGGFDKFLIGLSTLGTATLPWINRLSGTIGDLLGRFGDWLVKISNNGQLDSMLDKMLLALKALADLASGGWDLLKSIVGGVGTEKASEFLVLLGVSLQAMTDFFKSDYGKFAIKGMVDMAEILLLLLPSIVAVFASIGAVVEGIRWTLGKIIDGIVWLLEKAGILHQGPTLGGAVTSLANQLATQLAKATATKDTGNRSSIGDKGYATGGILTSPQYGVNVAENGPEAIIPLNDPTRAQQLLTMSGLSNMVTNNLSGPEGNQIINVRVSIGQRELTEIIDARVTKMLDRVSQNLAFGMRSH